MMTCVPFTPFGSVPSTNQVLSRIVVNVKLCLNSSCCLGCVVALRIGEVPYREM